MSRKEINHKYYLKTKEKYKKIRELTARVYKKCSQYKLAQKIYKKIYRQKYQKELAEYMKKYRNNPTNRLISNLRSRIWAVLKNNVKSTHTVKLIGCSLKELKQHLQTQFKKGMNWKNYGKWHVDHIIGCCNFDLSKPEEQRKCFNYRNLQPLWAIENWSKKK